MAVILSLLLLSYISLASAQLGQIVTFLGKYNSGTADISDLSPVLKQVTACSPWKRLSCSKSRYSTVVQCRSLHGLLDTGKLRDCVQNNFGSHGDQCDGCACTVMNLVLGIRCDEQSSQSSGGFQSADVYQNPQTNSFSSYSNQPSEDRNPSSNIFQRFSSAFSSSSNQDIANDRNIESNAGNQFSNQYSAGDDDADNCKTGEGFGCVATVAAILPTCTNAATVVVCAQQAMGFGNRCGGCVQWTIDFMGRQASNTFGRFKQFG